MEINEIKQALLKFMPQLEKVRAQAGGTDEVQQLMKLFLEQVLGYDPKEEIVSQTVKPDQVRLPIQFDEQIKFMLQAVSPQTALTQALVNQGVDCALTVRAQLLVLTNGIQFILYDIDTSSGQLEVDAVFELNLLTDDVDRTAVNLWIIGKKDCGKRVIINTSQQGASTWGFYR